MFTVSPYRCYGYIQSRGETTCSCLRTAVTCKKQIVPVEEQLTSISCQAAQKYRQLGAPEVTQLKMSKNKVVTKKKDLRIFSQQQEKTFLVPGIDARSKIFDKLFRQLAKHFLGKTASNEVQLFLRSRVDQG